MLHDLNLAVRGGEFVALLGANGAGKTSLLRSILGLVPVSGGDVTITSGGAPVERSQLGYVPQRHEFAWDFPISVERAVLSGRTAGIGLLRQASRRDLLATLTALDRVGMRDLCDRPIGELSGGQRQRVLVARALAQEPALLLLDEPFTGLDVPSQEMLTELFGELAAEGCAVLMTTHDLLAAVHDCSRLCLMNGSVVADGAPETLGDPEIWRRTFGLGEHNPHLTALLHAVAHTREKTHALAG